MKKKRSVDYEKARLVWGGDTDTYSNRAGWWERKIFERDPSDLTIFVDPEYNRRPDLMAFDLYGDAAYASFILQYNNILDYVVEFVTGTQLQLPTQSRLLLDIVTQPTGGVTPEDQV